MKRKNKQLIEKEVVDSFLAKDEELTPNQYPTLSNISSAFIYQFVPVAQEYKSPEYIYIKTNFQNGIRNEKDINIELFLASWNLAWEARHIRYDMLQDEIPDELKWLSDYKDSNIFLLPLHSHNSYHTYSPLFHLLPSCILKKFNLPLIHKGNWPFVIELGLFWKLIDSSFKENLSKAFALHIWKHLCSSSKISAFSPNDPIKLLAHNLDFWLPYIDEIIQEKLKGLGRVKFEDDQQLALYKEAKKFDTKEVKINRPSFGGYVWLGEEEANDVLKELVEKADTKGNLRNIIDAVHSNRVKDDFSAQWSYAKEDFERKLYKKRSKIKVTFVELDETIPVHGPDSEVHEKLLWEDFLALLDKKERRIVVCLRNGITKLGDISERLGYANHSPISKALEKIRKKAINYLEN